MATSANPGFTVLRTAWYLCIFGLDYALTSSTGYHPKKESREDSFK